MNAGTNPRTFTGYPFASYRVEPGSSSLKAKFTRELRDSSSNSVADRTETMFTERSGSWPTFEWARSPWTLVTSGTRGTPVSAINVENTSSSGTRTEILGVTADGGSTNYLAVTRAYSSVTNVGEVLTTETAGTGSGLTSTFDYYNNTSNAGSLGQVKSVALPGGGWEAYDYYEPTTGDPQAGQLKTRYRPFANSPSSIGFSGSSGEVRNYEYTTDYYGAKTWPSLIETKVNGTTTAKTTFAYSGDVSYPNGLAVFRITRTDYSATSSTLVTEICAYRPYGDSSLRSQVYSVSGPDGVRKSYVYEKGTWSGSPPSFSAGSGTARRISTITGSTNGSAGTQITSYNGKDMESLYVVAGKSTLETTILDDRALVVRTETAVWTGSAWQAIGWTTAAYNFAGQLTERKSSAGDAIVYSATYDDGHKTDETDEQGVKASYTYDTGGRIVTVTRESSSGSGLPTIGSLVTKYTYDAAGRRTQEEVGHGQSHPVTTIMAYDDSGRLTSVTPPGLSATTSSYNVSSRTRTITRPDGGTIIETANIDGRLASRTGYAVVPEYFTYGTVSGGNTYLQVNIGTSSSERWVKQTFDWLGRGVKNEKRIFGGGSTYQTGEAIYDSGGRLQKTTQTGRNPVLYQYDYLSHLYRTGLDEDNNGSLTPASDDRITETETYLESYSSAYWLRSDTKVFAASGSGTSTLAGFSRRRLTGHASNRLFEAQGIDAEGNVTTSVFDVSRSAKTGEQTETVGGISGSKVTKVHNGLPWKVTNFDGLATTLGFDGYLRANTSTNSRGKTTTMVFVNGTGRPSTVTDPSAAEVAYSYDTTGRLAWQRDPRNYYSRFSYNMRNQATRQWGDGAMPVEYGYDSTYGDRTTMKTFRGGSSWDGTTWPSSPGDADTTTWAYDQASGLLASKTDAASRTVSYTYHSSGQLATFTWARGTSMSYGYDAVSGDRLTVNYSDSTPDLTYTYTRLGQAESVTDVTGTRDLVYDSSKPWRLSAEALDSFYGDKVLTRRYETSGVVGRYDGFKLGSSVGSNSDVEQDYGYTGAGRFETILSGRTSNASTRTFSYAYKSDAPLVESLSITGGHAFTVTNTYDADRDLVTAVETKWSTTSRVKYASAYDERGFRTSVVQSGDAFADYGDATHRIFAYNGRGELTADAGYMNGTPTSQTDPLPGRLHEYAYDNAGNRQSSNRTGVSTLRDDYTTNTLNQYASRENNTVPVSGTANTDSNVAVKGTSVASGRKGRYWNDEITVNNLNHPWYGTLSIFTAKPGGGGGGSDLYKEEVRYAQLAALLQNFTYDYDGNLTSDGIWDYTWDAENRLTKMQTTTLAASCGYPNRELDFKYDYLNRRVEKRVINLTTSTEISYRRFLYDGWNLVAEYDFASSTLTLKRSYTWGLDVVQSLTASGGVGGLLQIADHASGNTYLPAYDGNGNIAALLNASSGSAAAIYEYSPFGEPLRAQVNDSIVADQPFRFSTKFTDVETGLVYYGHRYYEPKNGRFINRDPIEESGGLNLYGFCGNNGINRFDVLGHDWWSDLFGLPGNFYGLSPVAPVESSQIYGSGTLNFIGPTPTGPFATVTAQEADIETEPELAAAEISVVTLTGRHASEEEIIAYLNNQPINTSAWTADDWAQWSYYADLQGRQSAYDNQSGIDGHSPFQVAVSGSYGSSGAFDQLNQLSNSIPQAAPNSAGTPGNPNVPPTAAAGGGSVLGGIVSGALNVIGKVWNLPNTVIGVTVGLVGYGVGKIMGTDPGITFGHNGIEFTNNPAMFLGGAITLGNAIIYAGNAYRDEYGIPAGRTPADSGLHEQQHTYQGQILGPAYLPAAGLSLLLGTLFDGDSHGPHSFMEKGPQMTPPRPWP